MATKTWNLSGGGSWSTGGNWSPPGVPTATDDVIIGPTKSNSVVSIGAPAAANSVKISTSAATLAVGTSSLTLTSNLATALNIAAGHITIAGGQITDPGGLTLASGT